MYMSKLELTEGETLRWTIDLTGDDGQPLDLTGYTASCKIAKEYGSKALIKTYSLGNHIEFGSIGELKVIDKDPQLDAGDYKVEIEYTSPDGVKIKPSHLYLTVYRGI